MADIEDEQLLARIAGGDQQAMELFYRRHSPAVLQFAARTVVNPADAAEVMNEVMMEVWRKAATFSGESKAKTWLMSITHHKAVDLIRRKSRHDGTEELHEETEISPQCSLEQACSGAESLQQVQHCMKELKDGHRQVVYLTFFEGLSYPDIAGILGIPGGTVKTRMMHAKKQLMDCLSQMLGSTQLI